MSALKTPPTACSQLNTPPGLLDSVTSNVRMPTTDQQTLTSPHPALGATYCSTRTEQAAVSLANSSGTTSACKSIPLARVCIPDLPQSQSGWHIALRQWYNIDPKTGCALKDWPDAWFKESMRAKTAAKWSQWALIAHEYEHLGGTDVTFPAAYPEVNTMRVSDLLEAIQGKHGWRRKSQNNTPEQRYSGSPSPEPTTTLWH
ncbi:hypothetical protein L208DRAFT_1525912 [Tricholoma matsutake]|nr:hypothetical protein L208DRAFT_1525912 [Tricholoma matsutake 945]